MTVHNSRSMITEWVEEGAISNSDIEDVLKVSSVRPASNTWGVFFEKLSLVLGCLCFAFSLIFFIAYNWQEMSRSIKFILVEGALVISIVLYLYASKNSLLSRISLLLSSVCVGVSLALFGQTYQTGADTWQLFFTWSMLIIPWVLISRFNVMWLMLWALINLALLLYFETFGGLFSPLYRSDSFLWVCLSFNGFTWLLWELCSLKVKWLKPVWAIRFIAFYTGICLTWLAIEALVLSYTSLLGFWCWLAWMSATLVAYYRFKPDLFMLAGVCLSLISVAVAFMGENIIDFTDAGSFLVLAFSIVCMGASAAAWLRSVNKRWLNESR